MLRKILAIIICVCLIVPELSYDVYAAEYEKKYLPIRSMNDGETGTYEVLTDGDNVYIEINNLSKVIGFGEVASKEEEEKNVSYYMVNERYQHEKFVDYFIIYPKEHKMDSFFHGEKEIEHCFILEEKLYVDIIEVFNYLRIKAEIIGDELCINLPVYSISDFLLNDYRNVLQNTVSQLDLLENGESAFNSSFFDSLSLACNNFDFKLLIPGWGSTELKEDQYVKAIQTLNEEDEIFFDTEAKEQLKTELFDRGFGGVLATGKDLTSVMSVGGKSIQTAEEIIMNLSIPDEEINKYMDLLNWNGKNFDGFIDLRAWAEQANTLSDVLDISNVVVSAYETYARASNWNQECMDDLDVLINLDVDDFEDHKSYVKRIKKVAEKCYDENKNRGEAVTEQAIYDVFSLLLEKAVTEVPVYGKVLDCFILAVNASVAIAKCFGNVAEEMDKAELSYMVTCLINIAVASRFDMENKYTKINLLDMQYDEIDDFRTSLKTFIKSNLRCWSYIYYLNSDGIWENSLRGKEVRNKINKMQTYLTILRESEQYDYVLSDEELITYSPERIVSILQDTSYSLEGEMSEIEEGYYRLSIDNTGYYYGEMGVIKDSHGISYLTLSLQDENNLDYYEFKWSEQNKKYESINSTDFDVHLIVFTEDPFVKLVLYNGNQQTSEMVFEKQQYFNQTTLTLAVKHYYFSLGKLDKIIYNPCALENQLYNEQFLVSICDDGKDYVIMITGPEFEEVGDAVIYEASDYNEVISNNAAVEDIRGIEYFNVTHYYDFDL